MSKPSSAYQVQFCLNKPWQDDPDGNIPPWFVSVRTDQCDLTHILVNKLEINGHCFGGDTFLPNGKPVKMITCAESSLVWRNENDLTVYTTASTHSKVVSDKNQKRILIRLFTPWLVRRDPTEPAWRVLTEVDDTTFEERPAYQFDIIGRAFGYRHDFPDPIGPKMHIACSGTINWNGNHALIMTRD